MCWVSTDCVSYLDLIVHIDNRKKETSPTRLFSSLAFPSSQLMSRLSTLLSSFVYFCFFLWVSPFFFVLFVCTASFQIHMAPIFGNPFKTPTAKYLLPFMRFLNIPTSVSDIQSKNPYAPIAKTSTKTSDCIYAKLLVSLSHEFGDELLGLFAYGSRVYGNARPHR